MKPVVRYVQEYCPPSVGQGMLVIPMDHPGDSVSNYEWARTTEVVKVTEAGFETLNTVYVRV